MTIIRVHNYFHDKGRVSGWWLVRDRLLPNGDIHYTITILPLLDNERQLDGGRFVNFVSAEQPYRLSFPQPYSIAATEQKIEWISDRTCGPWSIQMEVDDELDTDARPRLLYSFSEPNVAVAFRMTFGARN